MANKNPFQENKGMITEDERKAIREGKLLSKLADDPAFQRYIEILKAQIMTRQSVVTMPALTIEKWVAQETVKGALGALVLAVNLVPDTIQTAKELAARHGIEFDGETPTE
jgi:hypothetical protein